MSAFIGLSQAVVAALLAAPALAGGRVRSGRRVAVPQTAPNAIDVHVERSLGASATLDGSISRWETLIAIDLYARATAGADGEAAVDSLLDAVFQRLASTPPPAGAGHWRLEPQISWDLAEADQTLVVASLTLRVSHFTGPASLAAAT